MLLPDETDYNDNYNDTDDDNADENENDNDTDDNDADEKDNDIDIADNSDNDTDDNVINNYHKSYETSPLIEGGGGYGAERD